MVALSLLAAIAALSGDGSADYAATVKPLLERRCYACHGALQQKSKLRVDTAALMLKGGLSGPALEPGSAEGSLLIEKVSESDAKLRMPPDGEPLTAVEVDAIRRWIDAGAVAPADEAPQKDPGQHWAFAPPRKQPIDAGSADPNTHAIDQYLEAAHGRAGVTPAPAAEAEVLLRRVTLDLTGLAPTSEERASYLNDTSADRYERLVDRLLASPAYGERWGRHWMDVWRYADWYGFGAEIRHSQPHIWRWRDWIVESLNADKGYDRMVVEMLAGDEVAPLDPRTLRATGYLARNWFKFNRNVWLQETVDHTAKAFLGMTFACARCHDHKYDPISQDDYYRLRAYFEPHDVRVDRIPGQPDTTKDGLARVEDAKPDAPTYLFHRGDEKDPETDRKLDPGLPSIFGTAPNIAAIDLPARSYYPALEPHIRSEALAQAENAVAEARQRLDAALAAVTAAAPATPAAGAAERGLALATKEAVAANAELESLRARIAADDARFAEPRDPKRADIEAIRAASAERLAAFRRADAELAKQEIALLDLARAAGAGDAEAGKKLAKQREDLEAARKRLTTTQAELLTLARTYTPLVPGHPAQSTGRRQALAQWIASTQNPLTARVAVNHVWMRHFGQPLVPTVFDFGNHGVAPTHPALLDWLAVDLMEHGWSLKHLHRQIVTSRAYCRASDDEPSSANATIDPTNALLWRMNPRRMEAELVRDNLLALAGTLDATRGGPELDQASALTTTRRSLYYRHAPEKQAMFLSVFDAANSESCYRRDVSIVPQQSLALVNSTLARAQARRLAARLSSEAPDASFCDDAFIQAAFTTVLGRAPDDEEQSICRAFLLDQSRPAASGAQQFTEGPEPAVPPSADPHQRARENLVHILFNHHDFVTIH